MPSVFTRNQYKIEDSFSSDSAMLTFTGGVDPALIQNINFNYSQNITRLYEVGGPGPGSKQRTYYVSGRTQGQAGIARVIGPKTSMSVFYTRFGNVCNAKSNSIQLAFIAGCGGGGLIATAAAISAYVLQGCVITNIGFSVQAMDMVFNENTALQYVDLEYNGK
jgi:hypothetical protein